MTKEEAIKRVCKMIQDRQESDKGPFFAIEDIAEAFVEFAVKDLGMLPPPHYVSILTREPHPRGEMILYDWEKKVD